MNGTDSRVRSDWNLRTAERKRILLNNIYGVDIDRQAVEVTKLSLLLKVLEEENEETVSKQLKLFKERALPSLHENIKCGNSLIGSDIYKDVQVTLDDPAIAKRINAFDWDVEFAEIITGGGFDAVIGNPPYLRQESLMDQKKYFETHYEVYQGMADLYAYFIEKGISLLRKEGLFSYIVANKWMRANYGKPLRHYLAQFQIEEIIDFGDLPVFQNATTYPCIIRVLKSISSNKICIVNVDSLNFDDLTQYVQSNCLMIKNESLNENGWTLGDEQTQALLKKLQNSGIPLGEYLKGQIYYGIKTGLNRAFVIDEGTKNCLIEEDSKSAEIIKPFVAGREIKRNYIPDTERKYLLFTRHGIDIKQYPAILEYLKDFKKELMPKPKDGIGDGWPGRKPGSYEWYEIQDKIDYYLEFEKPKVMVPAIVKNASYAYDVKSLYSNDKTTIIPTTDFYVLGLLNSSLIDYFMHTISSTKQGGYFEYKPMYLSKIPIRTINPSDPADVARHDKIITLVERMLDLNKRLPEARTDQEQTIVKRQIAATDKEIDELVYELYGLTEEERKIVEGTI